MMKTVRFPCGVEVPALGMGTWNIGDAAATRQDEITTIQLGIDLGLKLIDTAEMYGEGRSEELVGEAIQGRRKDVYLVSKVYPHHATRRGMIAACEHSLKRLKVDTLDLYLLHWRGSVPLAETLAGFETLRQAGKIQAFGVSNLDLADLKNLWALPGGERTQTNQLLYNLSRRGIEWDLLPWLRERHIPVMAYSPFEQGRLLRQSKLQDFAQRHGMTASQAALAWLLNQKNVIVIPKTGSPLRLRENHAALNRDLNQSQLAELSRLFPGPTQAEPLEML